MFDPDSRYAKLPTRTYTDQDGRKIVHVTRRFLPRSSALLSRGRVTLALGDRLDLVAERVYGDSLAWWRLPDGNPVENPDDLEVPGATLLIASENP